MEPEIYPSFMFQEIRKTSAIPTTCFRNQMGILWFFAIISVWGNAATAENPVGYV
jgi:hypothetical protein